MLVHCKQLRPYTYRVQNIGAVFHDEQDFGKLEYVPMKTTKAEVASFIPEDKISHLHPEDRDSLRRLFQQYTALFFGRLQIGRLESTRLNSRARS